MVDFPKLSISGFSLFLTKTSDHLNQIFSNAFLHLSNEYLVFLPCVFSGVIIASEKLEISRWQIFYKWNMYLFLMLFWTYQPSSSIIIHHKKVYGSHSMNKTLYRVYENFFWTHSTSSRFCQISILCRDLINYPGPSLFWKIEKDIKLT